MKRFLGLTIVALLGFGLVQPTAQAASGFDALAFKHASDHGFYLTTQGAKTLGANNWTLGLALHFMDEPVIIENPDGSKLRDVVGQQFSTQAFAAYGVTNWLNLGLSVDFVPYQKFSHPLTAIEDNGARMGDIRLDAKFRLVDNQEYPVGIALVPFITLPTGDEFKFTGNGNITGGGQLVFETKRFNNRFSMAANVGGQFRETAVLNQGTEISNQLLYGLGANLALHEKVELIAEAQGSTLFKNFFDEEFRPLIVRGALRFLPTEDFAVTVGGGAGLLDGVGDHKYETFLNLAYTPSYETYEAPPPPPEPVKSDADGDGVWDLEDSCPAEAGEASNCGCPEQPLMEIDAEAKQIRNQKIHFEFNKATIRLESHNILDTIARALEIRPDITHVSIVGHTDNIGSDSYNQKLSERRASAVRRYLVNKGADTGRLSNFGKGEAEPIAGNDTDEGRALNRRVQFDIDVLPRESASACETAE